MGFLITHNRPLGRADWAIILHPRLASKGSERFNGHASPLGFSEWACVFRWAWLFLGPGDWACEPYFSNPINTHSIMDDRQISKKTHPIAIHEANYSSIAKMLRHVFAAGFFNF